MAIKMRTTLRTHKAYCPVKGCNYVKPVNADDRHIPHRCPKHRQELTFEHPNLLSKSVEYTRVKNYGKSNNNGIEIKLYSFFEYEKGKFRCYKKETKK